jgi:transposase
VAAASDQLPDDVDTLRAALIEARAKLSGAQALIEHLQLVIAKFKREMFGPRSERSQRVIDQLELQLEELAAAAGEDEAKAARVQVQSFTRRQAARRNFPADLPRRRIVSPRRARVRAAAAANSLRSGRMSPRRSMSSRGNGS